MGAFFGSVHLRSDDVAGVHGALEALATRGPLRFWMAPARAGWISLYPSESGQDRTVSAELAASLAVPVLHLLLHDDDVFAYRLYRSGVIVDEYCSAPDYFEPAESAQWQATAGRPELLAALVPDGDRAQLAAALERAPASGDAFRARWQLQRVASLLNIANVETSYEHLREGETKDIEGWQGFRHVPDLAVEKEATRRRRAEVAADTKRLQREGRLLFSEKARGPRPLGFAPQPVLCAHPRGGFLRAWCALGAPRPVELEWWRSDGLTPSGLRISSKVYRIRVSSSGRFLGVGHAAGEWSAELVDLASGQRLATVALPSVAEHVSFSADERLMICRSQGALLLAPTTAADQVESVPLEHGRNVACHPSGEWLVADVPAGLAIVSLPERRVVSQLKTATHDLSEWMTAFASGRALAGFHPAEVPTSLAFSPDGRLLVLAVREGLRVYTWADVLRAEASLPGPVFSASSSPVRTEHSWLQNTYGLEIDGARGRAYFSGLEGCVRALDLDSGETTMLLEVPGAPALTDLALASDAASLAVVANPGLFERKRNRPAPLWQVWRLDSGA
jgi:hypothetical protein